MKIYFSCTDADNALLRELRGFLAPWLYSWIDENELQFNVDKELNLKANIDLLADFVVLFVSRSGLETPWVRREIEWSQGREEVLGRRFLLPVLIDDVRDDLEVLGLATRSMIELVDHTEAGTRMLAEKLTAHLGGWMAELLRSTLGAVDGAAGASEVGREAIDAIRAVPAQWRSEVDDLLVRPFVDDVVSSHVGRIPLTPPQYYQRINAEMASAGAGCEVLAVSTLTSKLWRRDIDQTEYAARNLAAVERGAVIRRLFIIPTGDESAFAGIVNAQVNGGIDVRVASNTLIAQVSRLEDFVMFADAYGSRTYIALPTVDGSRRIRSGVLDLSMRGSRRLWAPFNEAWSLARPATELLEMSEVVDLPWPVAKVAPGNVLHPRYLGQPVTTPEEAAEARETPLSNELRTVILRTHQGLVAAHVPGDGVLSLSKIEDRLETAHVYLADQQDLGSIGLSTEHVSPLLEPVWSMPHLVTRRLLDLRRVYTNNGTATGYFECDPAVLVEASNVVVGDFEG